MTRPPHSRRIDRRTFLFGALAAPALAPSVARAAFRPDTLRLGIIATGGRGEGNWSQVAEETVLALCDVDLAQTARAAERFPGAQVVQDFRRVLDRDDIDAVVISTPDHWHALIAVWAMEAGKHVYCEKPLARTVYECRVMAETAREKKRVTQMGTQIHAGSNYRRVVELVRAGAIGTIRRVDVWCEKRPLPGKRATAGTPPPTLDYELWVGPAEWRPYDPNVVPHHWRWWWEFAGGVLADMGCHFIDLAHWALDLRHPERVRASGTEFPDADNKVPVEMRADFFYPARGDQPPVQLVWWHGIHGPRDEEGRIVETGFRNGVLFHGEQGQILADYNRHRLLPEEKFRDYRRPEPFIPESIGHHREWLEAIRSGGPTTCSFDYGGALSESVLLGNVAYRLGREIEWDPKRLRIRNVRRSEWEPLIRPEYRRPWKLRP